MGKFLPKFHVGQTVYSKVSRRSSSEPTTAPAGSKFKVSGVQRMYNGDGWKYICEDYDIYEFKESELMGKLEYAKQIMKGE